MGKIIALIPARSGSKRVPHKNIQDLGGKPLLVWSIETAKMMNQIAAVFVSTDSPIYERIANQAGARVIHRPPELAADNITDQEVILHAVQGIDNVDLIVYLRPTTPFRDPELVQSAIDTIYRLNGTGLRSVEEMSESAYKCFEMNNWWLEPLTGMPWRITDQPNQQLPKTYHPNGYVDIARAEIVKQGKLWGDKVVGFITPRTVEIDTPEDWELAEYEISKRQGS